MMNTDELDPTYWEAEDAARRVERYQTEMLVAKLRHAAALLTEINDEYEGLRFNWNPYDLTAEAEYLESKEQVSELNLDLLRKVLDKVVAEPDDHDQGSWMTVTGSAEPVREVLGGLALSCPAAACVAGWACALAGDSPFIDERTSNHYRDEENDVIYISEVVTPEDEVWCVFDRAKSLLGLNSRDALDIFDAGNPRGYVIVRLIELIEEAERISRLGSGSK